MHSVLVTQTLQSLSVCLSVRPCMLAAKVLCVVPNAMDRASALMSPSSFSLSSSFLAELPGWMVTASATRGAIPHRYLRLRGIQHSRCMLKQLNRLFHCSVDFVRELRSHSDVLFIWSIYTAVLTGRITDLVRPSACV